MVGLRLSIVGLCLLMVALPARGANILGLFSSHSPSHLILHMSMIKTLAENGHNVTVVTMMKPTVTHKDIHVIVVPMTDEQEELLESQMNEMAGQKNSFIDTMLRLMSGMRLMVDSQLELLSDPRFQRIYETKFDLMFMGYFINDFQLGVAAKLQVPVIVSWMQAPMLAVDELVGNPTETSYVPNLGTSLARGEKMGFVKRLQNLGMEVIVRIMWTIFDRRLEKYYNQQFGHEVNFPTLGEMKRNVSMLFTNSHSVSEGPIRPLVPAVAEIGGIQVKDQPDPLPEDIAQFLENAQNGAILLALGTNIKSTAVKPELVRSMFKVLSGLKQHVIWKWEDLDNTPGKSANILYKKWLPQDDILAHPKIKLFINHGGRGGITEAQYHGVPMLALPIFGDQPGNAENMQKAGYGVALDLLQLNEDNFKANIQEVLNNKQYALTIGRFSQLYRDRPLTAKQTVLYWTDYVLRYKGAPHLQSPSVHMGIVAYHNLDVYAVLTAALSLVLFLTWRALKFTCRKLCGKSKTSKKVKRQ
ncbi:UDP-glucosyltransferase 2 [Drosophila virilis]|uniref:Uncharacterized protein n=1 Tax=Drosophila virilis TaxID=7244 RepID=B4LUG5_DROVI|nr:UDP-glucuronosyltransferase 1-2 [Drosophila virilis]EDW64151.1 uncharacterized protein Dvir_GJ17307 [Drosophila virilis]